jgi:prepilin-type N-terminal cleavage/methylation domain-containing protein
MKSESAQRGFSLVEALVSIAILSVVLTILATLLVENSKVAKAQRLQAQAQANARSTLSVVTQKLRLAGWDPSGAGISGVALDSDPTDSIHYIDLFADLNADGDVNDAGESITIRHVGDRVEWRETSTDPFEIIGVGLTNDADGDGVAEPMFTADTSPDPTRITVRITAASDAVDPHTGEPVRFTIASDVTLRNAG